MPDTENPETPEEPTPRTPPTRGPRGDGWYYDGGDENDPDEPGYLGGTAMMRN